MERRDNYAAAAAQARALFPGYDHGAIARKLHTQLDEAFLYTRMLSRNYRICRRTGAIEVFNQDAWRRVDDFNETLTLLDLVCDSRENRHISGRWKNQSAFGLQFHQNLLEQADPWAAYLQAHPAELKSACDKLNAVPAPYGDCAYSIPLFEDLGVMLQLWYGDEEFPASARWLWDENALMYLKYETMYYAVGMIRSRLPRKPHHR